MAWFSFIISFSLLCMTNVIMQRPLIIVRNDLDKPNPDELSSLTDAIWSFVDKGQETSNERRCPQKWRQFGYSCYFLSNYMSTLIQANHTCDLFHLNNSRLMYIQRPVELFYAAHVMIKNDLDKLLLEIHPDLMKGEKMKNILFSDDHDQWKEFGKKILEEKKHSSKQQIRTHPSDDDKTNNRESTGDAEYEMINDDKDPIAQPCDQIKWNVMNENSNILILTIEIKSNKSICSLSNADVISAYSHVCQYELDRCLNNLKCGKHGRCVNSLSNFNCSCFFLSNGVYCDKWSLKDIQMIIAFFVILIGSLWLITTSRQLIRDLFQWFINCFRRRQTTSPSLENNDDAMGQSAEDQDSSTEHTNTNGGSHKKPKKSKFSPEQRIRLIWVLTLSVVLFLILIGAPIIHYIISVQMKNMNSTKLNSRINDSSHRSRQCKRSTIFRIDNFIFIIISTGLFIFFSYLNTPDQNDDANQSREDERTKRLSIMERIKQCRIAEPIKLFYITDRYTTAAVIMIQMFEILEVLDKTLNDISEASAYGIFFEIFKRLLFVILNVFRYYPILASLQFQNIHIRSVIFVYVIGCITHMLIRDNSCIYWLAFSKKVSPLEQTNIHMDMNLWSFVYSFTKNGVYCLLLGYIGAELSVRLFYDLIYIAHKRKIKISKIPTRKIDQYSFQEDKKKKCFVMNSNRNTAARINNVAQSDKSDQQGWCLDIRKYLKKIYHWEDDFRFTTVVVCTYTIAFTFLVYLTCMLILLYTTGNTNYVTYLKDLLERLLKIEIKEQSFKGEVIASAVITMIIFGVQLVHSMQNFKDSVRDLYDDYSDLTKSHIKPDEHEIIPKSVQYPAFILRYLLGGFIICFNLILFILIVFNIILNRMTSFKWTLISIASALFVYGLQKIINLAVNEFFTSYGRRDDNNLRRNRPYSILLYFNLINTSFIGILSSIIRLITSILVNILYIPRIDYSCFVKPLQHFDSAHMAFLSFIRWELIYTHDILLKFSASLRPVLLQGRYLDVLRNLIDITDIPPKESTAVTLEQEGHPDHDNKNGVPCQSDAMNENPPNRHTQSSTTQSQHRSSNITSGYDETHLGLLTTDVILDREE